MLNQLPVVQIMKLQAKRIFGGNQALSEVHCACSVLHCVLVVLTGSRLLVCAARDAEARDDGQAAATHDQPRARVRIPVHCLRGCLKALVQPCLAWCSVWQDDSAPDAAGLPDQPHAGAVGGGLVPHPRGQLRVGLRQGAGQKQHHRPTHRLIMISACCFAFCTVLFWMSSTVEWWVSIV